MWVFTKKGFFSVVEDRDNKDRVIVRARSINDIERMAYLLTVEPEITLSADYPFRLRCSKEEWATVMQYLATSIDYDNFKNTIKDDPIRSECYTRIWAVAQMLEDTDMNGSVVS